MIVRVTILMVIFFNVLMGCVWFSSYAIYEVRGLLETTRLEIGIKDILKRRDFEIFEENRTVSYVSARGGGALFSFGVNSYGELEIEFKGYGCWNQSLDQLLMELEEAANENNYAISLIKQKDNCH